MSVADWLMLIAVVFFVLSGVAKMLERQTWLGLALLMLGLANAILLTLARK